MPKNIPLKKRKVQIKNIRSCKVMKNIYPSFFFIILTFLPFLIFAQNNKENMPLAKDWKHIISFVEQDNLSKAFKALDSLDNSVKHAYAPQYYIMKAVVYFDVFERDSMAKLPGDSLLDLAYGNILKAIDTDTDSVYKQVITKLLLREGSHYLYQGVIDFNRRNYQNALHSFRQAEKINNHPFINLEDTILYFTIAQTALKLKDTSLGILYIKKSLWHNYASPDMVILLANHYLTQGKKDSALITLTKGWQLNPQSKDIMNELANFYLKEKNYQEAKNVLLTLSKQDSSDVIMFTLGSIFDYENDVNKAEKYYKKAIKTNPNNKDALYNLGLLYYKQAIDLLRKSNDKKTKKKALFLLDNSEDNLLKYFNIDKSNQPVIKMLVSIYKLKGKRRKEKEFSKYLQ